MCVLFLGWALLIFASSVDDLPSDSLETFQVCSVVECVRFARCAFIHCLVMLDVGCCENWAVMKSMCWEEGELELLKLWKWHTRKAVLCSGLDPMVG